jgi:hypothetical protein
MTTKRRSLASLLAMAQARPGRYALKAVMLAVANQGFIGAVMEPTGPLIRDIWQIRF